MYNYISGKLVAKEPAFVVIEVAGIGYEIKVSLNTFTALKQAEEAKLFTYFYVKEDAQTLYGFLTEAEKKLFSQLIGVSGVGPSTGLMIFSSLTTQEIQQAIAGGNARLLQSVKGIGAKTAQRIVLELKDKLSEEVVVPQGQVQSGAGIAKEVFNDAVEALTVMGFQKSAAEKTIRIILGKYGHSLTLEEIIRHSLKTR